MAAKPKMSKMEASYHANSAGIKASEKVRESGDDAETNKALLDTTSTSYPVACGWSLKPLTIGTAIVQEEVFKLFLEWTESKKSTEAEAKYLLGALENMIYADPLRLRGMMKSDFESVIEEARRLCYDVPITERHKMMEHQAESVALFDALVGKMGGKKAAAQETAAGK